LARREPNLGPERIGGARLLLRGSLAAAVALAGFVIYAGFIEPYRVGLERVELVFPGLPPGLDGFKILQVSDLESHGAGTRESQVAEIGREAAADLVVVTGDLVAKTLHGDARSRAARHTASLIGSLPSKHGIYMVEGHGEHIEGKARRELLDDMAERGVRYLEDQVATLEIDGSTLALAGLRVHPPPRDAGFQVLSDGRILQNGNSSPGAYLNLDLDRPLPASGYELRGELRFSQEASGIGITFSNLMTERKDRFYRMRRTESGGSLKLSPHGTTLTRGTTATRVRPSPGPWYGFHILVGEEEGATRVRARLWPADAAEPETWQIDCVNEAPGRPVGGTIGVWTSGPGRKEIRSLKLTGPEGEEILSGGTLSGGEIAAWKPPIAPDYLLGVDEEIPAGSFVVAIAHSPDAFPGTAALGWPLLLAGHTQGGQVRLPFIGAIGTDTALGRKYAAGLFERDGSRLYITRGVGTSRIPVRFLSPPEVTLLTLRAGGERAEAGR